MQNVNGRQLPVMELLDSRKLLSGGEPVGVFHAGSRFMLVTDDGGFITNSMPCGAACESTDWLGDGFEVEDVPPGETRDVGPEEVGSWVARVTNMRIARRTADAPFAIDYNAAKVYTIDEFLAENPNALDHVPESERDDVQWIWVSIDEANGQKLFFVRTSTNTYRPGTPDDDDGSPPATKRREQNADAKKMRQGEVLSRKLERRRQDLKKLAKNATSPKQRAKFARLAKRLGIKLSEVRMLLSKLKTKAADGADDVLEAKSPSSAFRR